MISIISFQQSDDYCLKKQSSRNGCELNLQEILFVRPEVKIF